MRTFLKNKLSPKSKRKIRNFLNSIRSLWGLSSLNRLGKIYKTDKIDGHFYTKHYASHFKRFRLKRVKVLEIGVGGYNHPTQGGNSLRMWKKYFPFGKIFAIDIFDKSQLEEGRIKIFCGSQVDHPFLDDVIKKTGSLDIIIDDGSHINEHVIETFKKLFPVLNDGGIYVIEDTQTSYWSEFGGDSENLSNTDTLMNFFKGFTDSLNHKEFILKDYRQSYYDKKIISIHFYHNLIFIYKGNNDEESNVVKNNQFI